MELPIIRSPKQLVVRCMKVVGILCTPGCSLLSIQPIWSLLNFLTQEEPRYVLVIINNFIQANALQTRTAEGLALSLHVSFQYRINKNQIPKLYNLANIHYQGTIVRISRDIILKVGGQFNATNYWTDREKIGDYMKDALNNELQKAYTSCLSLQILKVDLPKSYEDSIVSTQVEVQKTNMRRFEQTAELIRQNISVIVSKAEQQIKVIASAGSSEAYRLKQFALAQTYNNTINAEANVYKKVEKEMGIAGSDLSEYLFLSSLMDQKNAKLLVGLQNSIINLNSNQPIISNK